VTLGRIIEANGPFFTVVFVVLSLSSLTLFIWRMWLNHNAKTDLGAFVARFKEALARGGRREAKAFCEEEPGIIPKVFGVVLDTADQGKVRDGKFSSPFSRQMATFRPVS